jgi:hypothetical protein
MECRMLDAKGAVKVMVAGGAQRGLQIDQRAFFWIASISDDFGSFLQ